MLELNGLQKDNYRVRIKIAMTGSNNFQDYYVFDVNGKDGTSKQMEYHPFNEPDTPGTTSDVSSQPEPTDPVSNPDEGEDVRLVLERPEKMTESLQGILLKWASGGFY